MREIIASIVLLVAPTMAAAEGAPLETREEFRLITDAHQKLDRYELIVDIRFDGSGGAGPLHAEVKCIARDRCLRTFGGLHILQTPQWLIAVDETRRNITVARQNLQVALEKTSSAEPEKLLDAWLQKGARVYGGELTISGRHWAFEPPKSNGPIAEFYTDPGSHLLRRFVYQPSAANGGRDRVEVDYVWGDASNLTSAEFDETRYIVERDDTVSPAEIYAGYKIIRTDQR